VLLDRHPLWLDAVEQVLDRIDIDVLGKTGRVADALALLEEQAPDLLIVELEDQDGQSVTSWLHEVRTRMPALKVIVLSSSDDPKQIDEAFAAGVVAYVIKTAQPEDVCAAVRQAFEHSIFLPGGDTARAVPASSSSGTSDASLLTRRELEILQLVAEGHSNAQVGRMLWVTEQTVKFHLSNIYRKLDVANRTEASRWAQMRNLLPSREVSEAASGGM
jgi:DNA-binding NarL/FixJ family response regulator